MSLVGMKPDQARNLAAAVEVMGGALAVQGSLIRRILERWDGDSSRVATFPARASWAGDQAKDIRRRVGILEQDPEGMLLFANLTGVIDLWERYKEQVKSVTTPLKVFPIMSGVEAAIQLQQRWAQGRNVAAARAVYEIRRYMGALPGNRKLTELIAEVLKARRIEDLYKQPWKWQKTLGAVMRRLRIPGAQLVTKNPPGMGVISRITLPAAVVTGAKEVIRPTHDGAQGWVDRGMGAVQAAGALAVLGGSGVAAALGASAAVAGAIPLVGWTALAVTGAYFIGSWAWDTWGDDIKAGVGKALNGAKSFVKKLKFW